MKRHGQSGRRPDGPEPVSVPRPAGTEAGAGGEQADRPLWVSATGTFRYRGRVHVFIQEAESQTPVLAVFAARGWPEWIENPLSDDPIVPRRRKLLQTVKTLNRV